jgi:hypothetical protein
MPNLRDTMPLYDFPKMLADLADRMDPEQRRAFQEKMAAMDQDLTLPAPPRVGLSERRREPVEVQITSPDDQYFPSELLRRVHHAAKATEVLVLVFPDDLSLVDRTCHSATFYELVTTLANLALRQRSITVARVPGPIGGALLEIALRCDVLTIRPAARIELSLTGPHGSGCYAAISERIGFVECERLFGASTSVDGAMLLARSVARYSSADEVYNVALAEIVRKAPALISIYAASRLSFPITCASIATLHGMPVGSA